MFCSVLFVYKNGGELYKAMDSVADTCFVFGDVKPYQMGVKNVDPDDVVRSIGVNLDAYRDIFLKEMLEAL